MEVCKLLLANFLEMLLKLKTFGTTHHHHLNLEKLPSTTQFSVYQYNDLILPGVTIQNVDVSQLVTLFTDFYVDLDAVTGHQSQQQQEEQTQSRVRAHLKRLDHQPYQYKIAVHSEQNVPGAVVRVFLGPKHDHQGRPISISKNQHLFVELDQFIQNRKFQLFLLLINYLYPINLFMINIILYI